MDVNQSKVEILSTLKRPTRLCAVMGGEVGLALALRWASAPTLSAGRLWDLGDTQPWGRWTLAQLVVSSATVLAWIAFAFLAASTLVTLLLVPVQATFAGAGRLAWLGGPLWWRRAVLGACGLGLVSPVGAHALAVSDGTTPHHCTASCAAGRDSTFALSGLRLPDLPAAQPHGQRAQRRAVLRIVRPGDSLWLIARGILSPSASTSAVCRRVDALYAANRAVIGPDPDLIFPGMALTRPGGTP